MVVSIEIKELDVHLCPKLSSMRQWRSQEGA